MTDTEIFRQIIEKVAKIDIHFEQWLDYLGTQKFQYNDHFTTIFTHRFAKAFWGEKEVISSDGTIYEIQNLRPYNVEANCPVIWQHHLKIMVLEKDPLKYLEGFL